MRAALAACRLIAEFVTVLLAALSPQGDVLAAGRVALVIGNGAYPDAPLANPVNDARAMSAKLTELGFEVSALTDADRRGMERAMVAFSRRLDADTTALFYYAGHGVQSQGRNYRCRSAPGSMPRRPCASRRWTWATCSRRWPGARRGSTS
ncbi:MAG: caspase family protein [Rhodocyclaceae bacterium]|nr:caspase family protein [Rhodocyclaceae bacterium]